MASRASGATAVPSSVDIGKIVNHTRRLGMGDIREVVGDRMEVHATQGRTVHVEPVHVAPADDATLLTKAARAWRQAEGEEDEFQERLSGALFWFGVRYTVQAPSEEALDEEVPSQWPPGGDREPEEDEPDPRIAEQLELDEDEGQA